MENTQVRNPRSLFIKDIFEVVPNYVVIKTIFQKTTGNINVISCYTGDVLTLKIIPFDNFVQIIEGQVEIIIDGKFALLNAGQSIIIPAHSSGILKARERLKMISTIIKSGYDEME